MTKTKILFVCAGNICRSPTAEAIFIHRLQAQGVSTYCEVDSAGIYGYHQGEPSDRRSCQAAAVRGFDLSRSRSRRLVTRDFAYFDYLLAMDESNRCDMYALAQSKQKDKIHRLLDFVPTLAAKDIPDPYYGSGDGFQRVLDLCQQGVDGLLIHLRQKHFLPPL